MMNKVAVLFKNIPMSFLFVFLSLGLMSSCVKKTEADIYYGAFICIDYQAGLILEKQEKPYIKDSIISAIDLAFLPCANEVDDLIDNVVFEIINTSEDQDVLTKINILFYNIIGSFITFEIDEEEQGAIRNQIYKDFKTQLLEFHLSQ
jgi:hypothetical protein